MINNLWFSIYDEKSYKGKEEAFFNAKDFDWAQTILLNKDVIVKEFYEVIKSQNLFNPYFNQVLASKEGSWKTIGLKFWSINNYKNQKHFSKTSHIINNIPELISASFNKLEAGVEVQPHYGDTNGIFRCHLGIEIPSKLPHCGFEVDNEKKGWELDDLIIFTDAHYHRAWNNTENDRYIFLFDIVRDEYKSKRSRIISTVLSSMFLQKLVVIFKIDISDRFQRKKLKPIVFVLKPFASFSVWFVNKFKVY
jgi:aspartyl/asparaginyl beta-hydroxylase (cupin superfamily)